LNAVDIAVVVVLLGSGVLALVRGFVYESLAMAGWAAAGLAAFWGLPYARPYAQKYISNATAADIAAGVAIFLVVLVICSIITNMISKGVRRSAISSVDRSLGFAFGLVRGLALASLCFIVATKFLDLGETEVLSTAKTKPLLATGSRVLASLVPSQLTTVEERARDAAAAVNEAQQTKDMFDRLAAPKPKGAEAAPAPTGTATANAPSSSAPNSAKPDQAAEAKKPSPAYDNRGLERLIETTK